MGGDQDMSCESCGFKALTLYVLRFLAGTLFLRLEWPGTKKKNGNNALKLTYHITIKLLNEVLQ